MLTDFHDFDFFTLGIKCPSFDIIDIIYIPITVYLFYPIALKCYWGTTDDFATISPHFVLISAALLELARSNHLHPLILPFSLFQCLQLLYPLTLHRRNIFAKQKTLRLIWPRGYENTNYDQLSWALEFSCTYKMPTIVIVSTLMSRKIAF